MIRRKNRKTGVKIGVLIAILILSSAAIFYYIVLVQEIESITVQVAKAHDDARTFTTELNDMGYGDEDGGWALLQLSPSYSFGLRFTNVSIPQGVTITNAYIELYSVGTPGHTNPNCKIYCDQSDNATNFSVCGVLDRCGRIYTKSYIRWNEEVPNAQWIQTPSVRPPLQEIIQRKNWSSGNAVAFLFVSEGIRGFSASFQNFENGYPARLYVEFEKPSA